MKKWIITVVCVLIVGIGGYAWFGSKTNARQQAQPQVRTAAVQKGTLDVNVSGSGTVESVTSEDIKSTVNNNSIAAVNVTAGQTVTKGATLITFTDGSTPIYATESGVITSVSVMPGERVTNGEVVAHITNYNDLQTVLAIDELDIAKVKVGQAVSITSTPFPDKTFTGTVTAVANEGTSTNGTSTFNVTVHISNSTGLKVGMSTEGSILTESKANALYVPVEAVHTSNNQKYVMVATLASDNQTVQTQNQVVELGIENDTYVEITKGLTEGQTVELPQLTQSSSSTSGNSKGFGGMGAMGGMGGMPGGGPNGGNGSGSASGRSGN